MGASRRRFFSELLKFDYEFKCIKVQQTYAHINEARLTDNLAWIGVHQSEDQKGYLQKLSSGFYSGQHNFDRLNYLIGLNYHGVQNKI